MSEQTALQRVETFLRAQIQNHSQWLAKEEKEEAKKVLDAKIVAYLDVLNMVVLLTHHEEVFSNLFNGGRKLP